MKPLPGRGNTAIQLASMASALLQREGKWLEAADALASICLDFPQAEQASECMSARHLCAITGVAAGFGQ